jgi:molybdate transport system ATP-binding protein
VSLTVSARIPDRGVDLAFEVEPGQTLALVGPNGAGKSTTLDVVAGVLKPYAGRVVLHGRELTRAEDGRTTTWVAPHRRRAALLAQDPLLFPHLSVLDNVAFGPRSRGEGRRTSRATARRWLEAVGSIDHADRRPAELSGGQAQRIAIARALAVDPDVLLLDEPLAALDVALAPTIRQLLRQVLADRSAVVVTHDVLDALLLADRVAVVEGGRIVEEGPTADVLSRPRSAFAAQIAGLNLVAGTWHDDGLVTAAGVRVEGLVAGPAPTGGQSVVAVFRPNAVAVHRAASTGSPRNHFEVTLSEVQPHAGYLRLSAGDLSADITPSAAAELGLDPGMRLHLTVKATEVEIYAV